MRELTQTYSPPWAPHVVGKFSARALDPETGEPLEQHWRADCGACGASWGPVACTSGMVQQHISRFATAHAHRDPLREGNPRAT